jgi:branched-subunit amino acid aminotransferase/4-amino-4-deoxychorismate lyase
MLDQSIGYQTGQWRPVNQMGLALEDLGLLQGVVAVERLRTYGGLVWQLERHLDRLGQTLRALSLSPLHEHDWLERIDQLLKINAAHIEREGDVGIVLMVTPGRVQSANTEIAHLVHLDHSRIEHQQAVGEHLRVPGTCAPPAACWPATIKVRARLHYYLAEQAAHAVEPNSAAVIVDLNGNLLETSAANLCAISRGRVYVPPADSVLPGVSAAVALDWFQQFGLSVQRIPLSRSIVEAADELVLLGTGAFAWTGTHLDGQPVGDGQVGAWTRILQSQLREATTSNADPPTAEDSRAD